MDRIRKPQKGESGAFLGGMKNEHQDIIITSNARLGMRKYNFKTQLAKGQEAERVLDELFRMRGWKTEETDMRDQRRGIDRWFSVSMKPEVTAVEYKTDFRAHETGNVYLETVSVGRYDDAGKFRVEKKGWLYTTEADYLMYYVPGDDRILLFVPDDMREFVKGRKLRSVTTRNEGYQGRGLLVPVDELAKIAKQDWKIGIDNQLTT